ncbi:MAG: transporter, partial [Caulobacteraceae bacterium]|nr:transporter [Caulobacteraceae bacterium]
MTQAAARPAHPRLVLLATILASSLAFIDGTVVNVGLPAIGGDFHADAAQLQWVVNAYLLPLSALLLLGGAAGDRFGRVRLLVIGTVMFAAASALCAFTPNLTLLLVGRTVQGIGSAMLMPNSLAILSDTFEGEKRGQAVGLWAAVSAAMAAIGPVIGGWMIDTIGWRAIFLINLPLAGGAILLALLFVHGRRPDKNARLDLLGGILATLSLGAITWGLTVGSGKAGWIFQAWGSVVAGLLLGAAFVWVEKRKGDQAMAPLVLFGSRSFVGLSLLTLFLYAALAAVTTLIPYVLISAAHYSATRAGSALAPFAILLALLSPMMGKLAGRIGSRLPLAIGPLGVAAGLLLVLRIGPDADYLTTVLPAILVMAIGMAGAVAPLTTAVLSSVPASHTGSASGLNSALARIGGVVATALLGGVLGAKGAALIGGFRVAIIGCMIACIVASASAL